MIPLLKMKYEKAALFVCVCETNWQDVGVERKSVGESSGDVVGIHGDDVLKTQAVGEIRAELKGLQNDDARNSRVFESLHGRDWIRIDATIR